MMSRHGKGKTDQILPPSHKPLIEGVTPTAEYVKPPRVLLPSWVDEHPPTSCINPDYPERSPRQYLVFRVVNSKTGQWFPVGESMYPVGEVVEWDFSLRGLPSDV